MNICTFTLLKRQKVSNPSKMKGLLLLLYVLHVSSVSCNIADSVLSYFEYEVCAYPSIRNPGLAEKYFSDYLENELFGQHIAAQEISKAVFRHLEDPRPEKPLTLSFHGWTGSGKSHTATFLMKSIYVKGDQSNFVKFFSASYHFPDPEKVTEYKELVKKEIAAKVAACPRSLFVFDEVDKLPAGLLDVLTPIISHPGEQLDGNDYKKAIFLFLGNAGAQEINAVTLDFHKKKLARDTLSIHDYQHILSNTAFENMGGWYKSELIDKILIKKFVPFLPLERRHALQCFRRLAQDHPRVKLREDDFEKMADQLVYWPPGTTLYSLTGCKRAESILLPVVERKKKIEEMKRMDEL